MAKCLTVLGFTDAVQGAASQAAMNAIAGPPVSLIHAGGVAALAQAARGTTFLRPKRAAAMRDLHTIQRRLEVACLCGPFLPADPGHAQCPQASVESLLLASSAAIRAALAGPGRQHQWDIVLHWSAEYVIAARRAEIAEAAAAAGGGRIALAGAVEAALVRECTRRGAALQSALAGVALATTPAGSSSTETGITVLLAAGGASALETALQGLPADISAAATADIRGPLPPVSFAAVRIDSAAPTEIAAAWRELALPEKVDAAGLRLCWRTAAAERHPDRGATDDGPIAAAGAAFRLLRDLLPPEPNAQSWSLAALQRHAACRMQVCVPVTGSVP